MSKNEFLNDCDALPQAILKGEIDLIKSICKDSKLVNLHRIKDGKTPLSLAAEKGDVKIIDILLQAGADIDATDNIQFTPLARAVQGRHAEAVEALLSAGADVNAFKGYKGDTLLHWAMERFHSSIFLNLMKHGAKIVKNDDGVEPCNSYFGSDLLDLFKVFDQLFTMDARGVILNKLNHLLQNAKSMMVFNNDHDQLNLEESINDALVSRAKLALFNNDKAHKILIDNLKICELKESYVVNELKKMEDLFEDMPDLVDKDAFTMLEDKIICSGELSTPHNDF